MNPDAVPGRSGKTSGTMANTPPVPKLTAIPEQAKTTTDSGRRPRRPTAVRAVINTVMSMSAVSSQWMRGEYGWSVARMGYGVHPFRCQRSDMYPENGRHSDALNDWTAANVPAAT